MLATSESPADFDARVSPRALWPDSQLTNKIRRIRPHLLAVEHVEGAQPLEKLAAEPLERQVDDLAAELAGQPPPASPAGSWG